MDLGLVAALAVSLVAAGGLDVAVRVVPYRRFARARLRRCAHPTAGNWNLVPVVGWFVDNSCPRSGCSSRVPVWILAAQLVLIGAGPALWAWGAAEHSLLAATGMLALTIGAVYLATMDAETTLLPDPVTLLTTVAVVGALSLDLLAGGDGQALVRSLVAGVVMFVGYLLVAVIKPGAMGLGDVKLAFLVGFTLGWVSWPAVAVGICAALAIALVPALVVKATGGRGIPFGPFMLVGVFVGVLAGPWLFDSYLALFGL